MNRIAALKAAEKLCDYTCKHYHETEKSTNNVR